MDLAAWEEQLTSARHTGSGPDGLARAVVDGTGRVLDVQLDPAIMRRTAGTVAKELLAAVTAAQDAAQAKNTEHADGLGALMQRATADAEAYRQEARRQLDELSTLVSDLLTGRERIR